MYPANFKWLSMYVIYFTANYELQHTHTHMIANKLLLESVLVSLNWNYISDFSHFTQNTANIRAQVYVEDHKDQAANQWTYPEYKSENRM